MTEELKEEVKRVEELVALTWKLAKAVMRGYNKTTKIFNDNFDVFEENVNRNAKNIDKIVKTIEGLMGESAEYDKEHKDDQKIDQDSNMMYL